MSAIQRLLHMGIPAVLVVGMTGCMYAAATPVSTDILGNDRQNVSQPTPAETLRVQWEPPPTKTSATSVHQRHVGSILPAYGDSIREMRQQNADVIGWLHVPDTTIDHPILQNPTENNTYPLKNNYYLNRDFYGNPDKNGVFCADYRADFSAGRDALSHISALYGHSWDDNPNGTLFAQLKKYRDADFARSHPYIFFSTEAEDMAWEVFAVFDTTIYLPYVRPNLSPDKFLQTLDMVQALTYYSYDIAVSEQDKLLVLSTCTFSVAGQPYLPEQNDYRFVVMARLADPSEPLREEAVFAVNECPLLPDATRSLRDL